MAEIVDILLRARMDASEVAGEVGTIQKQLQKLTLPKGVSEGLEKSFSKLTPLIKDYQKQLEKGFSSKKDINNFNNLRDKIDDVFRDIKTQVASVNGQEVRLKVDTQALDRLEKELQKSQEHLSKAMDNIYKSNQTPTGIKNSVKELQNAFSSAFDSGKLKFPALSKIGNEISKALRTKDFVGFNSAIEQAKNHIAGLKAGSKINLAQSLGLKYAENDIKSVDRALMKFLNDLSLNKTSVGAIESETQKIARLGTEINKIHTESLQRGLNEIGSASAGIDKCHSSLKGIGEGANQAADSIMSVKDQVSQLRTQANYFFSLQNMGRLISRGIREAAESVRDLDKAMTDTAVVTEKTVGDLWNDLPKYTKLANKLGATTQGAYETMTLYFQQGLNDQETFEIGEETMKMARIAGLDYAQTTNMMTAALRGFNMELNQTSAKRVNDVYSELAAITASDTRELGLAMERTASIAHSAGMDFGNTTAFLAQMIETTREAPENLGTAMKTIIARFQELKQNPYEISEVEGEEVDFNRVDKALKTIGVDLMDNRDKFRDLDDVFMDISSKWDSLSQTQQRYIATIAAGSRQQSRFLAMVQNYDRLKELTDAAANSEDAATVQFNKTLDSYEAKVNKLKNAWQKFTMSLANNKAVKGGVDLLQKIITLGNKIIDTFGKAGKAIGGDFGKGLAEMIAAFGLGAAGFKGLKGGANLGLGLLSKATGSNSAGSKFFMGREGSDSGVVATKITNPIVSAINRVVAAIQKKPLDNSGSKDTDFRSDRVKEARGQLYSLMQQKDAKTGALKSFTIKDINKQISDLTKTEQRAIYNSSPGLRDAFKKSFLNAYKNLNLSKESEKAVSNLWKDLNTQVANGDKTFNEALRQGLDPYEASKLVGEDVGKELTAAIDREITKNAKTPERQKALNKLADKKIAKGDLTKEQKGSWVQEQLRRYQGLDMAKGNGMSISKTTDAMMKFSGATSAAGQSVMGLGMALSSLGFGLAGNILMTVGNGIMGIGMAAEGASVAVSALGKALKGVSFASLLTNPIFLGVTALTAAATAATVLYKKNQNRIKEIKKEAKKVENDYEKTITKTTQNINKLNDSKDMYTQLKFGVDENNNNINLGTAEYSDYLKIISEIAKMHPEMVKGYNAQGQAILNTTNAVEDAIAAEEKRQRQAEKDFATTDSLDKLIAGRNETKRWQVGQASGTESHGVGRHKSHLQSKSQLQKDSQTVIDTIQKLKGGNKLLEDMANQFGIQASDFTNLSDEGIRVIQEHGAAMLEQVQTQFSDATDKTTKQTVKSLQDSIAQVGKDTEGIEAVTEPIYKSLSTFASQERLFDNIPEEFKAAAEQGLKEISKLSIGDTGKPITGSAMQQMARNLGNQLEDLGGHADKYKQLMEDVQVAQDEYVKNLDETSYRTNKDVLEATSYLSAWATEARQAYKRSGNETDKILAETYENQLARIKNFTTEGAAILSEGFNTFSDEIAAANGAFEDFQKQIEGGDFYTGANNFKQIFDEIEDGIDNVGKGSQTWWKGAEKLLGENNKNIKLGNFDEAEKQIQALKPMFEEGQKGVDAFVDHVKNADIQNNKLSKQLFPEGKTIADIFQIQENGTVNLNDLGGLSAEKFAEVANQLGMSDKMLVSMLNKAKQFYDIDFSNVDVLRSALAASESSIVGLTKTSTESGKVTDLYTRRSTFEAEAEAQGYRGEDLKQLEDKLTKQGVKLVNNPDDIKKSDMEAYTKGIQNMDTTKGFISAFSQLGFSREEIFGLYNREDLGLKESLKNEDGKTFDQTYTDVIKEQEAALAEPAQQTADKLSETNSLLSSIYAALTGGGDINSTLAEDQKRILGDKGIDTANQYFGEGRDKNNHEFKTYDEYSKARDNLEKELGDIQQKKSVLEDLLANNALKGKQKEEAEAAVEAYDGLIKSITSNLEDGAKRWEEREARAEALQQQREAAQATVDETKGLTKPFEETAIDKNNQLDISKLNEVLSVAIESGRIKKTEDQTNVIGQYLQNSSKALVEQKADNQAIKQSMESAAKTMAEKGMKAEEIASALNQGYGTKLTGKDVNKDSEGNVNLNLDETKLQEQLSNLHADVEATIVSVKAAASGQNNPNSMFRKTGTMARGSRKGYTIPGRPTLMGEEGEEVVWEPKRNEAYIVGSSGPQFGNISKDAVVWNAQQTKKIKRNSKTTGALGTGARGITPIGTMKGGNAGGGGGLTIPGTFDIDAIANVQEVKPPVNTPEIPVKGKLEVEGAKKGGLLSKIKNLMGGDKEGGPSINVAANVTKITPPKDNASIKGTITVDKINPTKKRASDIKGTATVTKVIKSGKVTGEPVKVKASAEVSGKASGTPTTATVKTKADGTAQKSINSIKHTGAVLIKTKADNTAQRAINAIKGKDVTIHIKPTFDGSWTKNATVHVNTDANGQNNYIAHRTTPSFGSAASGRYGRLGPKGKGGLTLTGEKGFEIAWLPSESRSMILGAEGPQMLNLPKDAVVYTHEQSKDILRKKQTIEAGSHAKRFSGNMGTPSGSGRSSGGGGGSKGGGSKGGSSKGKSGKGSNKDKQNTKETTKILQTAGKINLWWWNWTKKVEATQRKIDQAATEFNKAISKFGATTDSLKGVINNYRKPLNLQIEYNTTMSDKASKQLNTLDKGDASVQKKVAKAQKKVKKAEKKYKKKKSKSNKKALDKAKKDLNKAKTGINYDTVSFDVTEQKTTKTKKGKKKVTKKKVTKKAKVNLAPYIELDKKSGAYQVKYEKINKAFGKNKSKATAVGEAAKKKVEDLQNKKNTAEDNIRKAQEALEELGKKVSETFFQWENELTEIYNLTQQIANLSSFSDRFDSQIELGLSKLSAGFGDTISTIADAQTVLGRKNNTIQNQLTVQQQMIDARQRELDRMLSSSDEQALIDKFTNMSEAVAGGKEAKQANINFATDQKLAADMALSYLKNLKREADGSVTYEVDWKAFEAARYNKTISNETYEKIKKYLDDLGTAATDFNDSIKTQTDFVKQTYDTLREYQDYIVDFEDTIIKGVEEEIEQETQNAKKISDSIHDNLKKLLDEVKNKLDERRKQEDNLKTEQEIAQKQQRLAALRADTSGGHQVEIAQLEKEIAEAQQSYQRTLEDQLLDKLQQQADQAAEQRDRLIELQETTNKLSEESNRELVNMWLKDPNKYREELKAAWLESQGYDEKGTAGQYTLLKQWDSVFAELVTAVEQSGFNSENGIFQTTANNVSALVNLVTQLVNSKTGNNTTVRDTIGSIKDYEINAENAKFLKENLNVTAKQLAENGYKAEHLIGDPSNPTFSAKEVKDTGYFSATDLKNAGINTVAGLKNAGYSSTEVKQAGFNNLNDYIGQYSWQDIGKAFDKNEFKAANVSYANAKTAGYTMWDLKGIYSEATGEIDKYNKEQAYKNKIKAAASNKKIGKDEFLSVKAIANAAGHAAGKYMQDLANTSGLTWKQVIEAAKAAGFSRYSMAKTFNSSAFIKGYEAVYGKGSYAKNKKSSSGSAYGKYAKGGIADYTGPAWLDGTPSKPELVLNAADTQNFLALKDVLSKAVSSSSSISNSYGDATYEININVDHINSDYDVDRMAERVKKIIVKDAGYRNVTQVRNFR